MSDSVNRRTFLGQTAAATAAGIAAPRDSIRRQ